MLDDPKFIHLIFSPADLLVNTRVVNRSENMTHRIALENLVSNQSYGQTCIKFIRSLRRVCVSRDARKSSRIPGEIMLIKNIGPFDLWNVVPHSNDRETRYE